MRSKLLNAGPPATYAVVLDSGDELVKTLRRFAEKEQIHAASVSAIGAFEKAVLGYFDWKEKKYRQIPVDEQVEVLSLIGDVAVADEKPELHLHAVLGKRDGSTVGGHVLEGRVRPTLEIMVTRSPAYLEKRKDPETGLALIALD